MGDLVVQQFVSADGFAANDQNEFDLFDGVEGESSEFDQSNLEWLERVGAIILGARTYRMFASYWPTPAADGEIVAPKINSLPKYVFSRSLTSAPWGDHREAEIVSGDAAQAIRRLKSEIPGDLVLWGSLSLTHSLWQARVVDLVRLVLLPVALGSGRGVFPAEKRKAQLRLVGSETLGSLVAVDYAVDPQR
jgi:dihydrofolate reductase